MGDLMKKFIKNNIIGFILGSIIFGSIGSAVAYNYNAKDVSYKNTNVEDALKDLYDGKVNFNDLELIRNANTGYRESYKSTSVTLQPGKYIIFETSDLGTLYNITSGLVGYSTEGVDLKEEISNATCTELGKAISRNNSKSSVKIGSTDIKTFLGTNIRIKYCDVKQTATITVKSDEYNDDSGAEAVAINAIKLTNK